MEPGFKVYNSCDTSQFVKADDLANLKSEVDKLDIDKLSDFDADKLKTVPIDLSKLSDVMLFERKIIKYKVKIKDIEGKITSITNLATNSALNPIQDGEGKGKKSPPPPLYQFFPVTNTNIWIGPQNFFTFSFNPFTTHKF